MIKNPLKKCLALAGAAFAIASTSVQAQPIYTNTFNTDDSANWSVNFSYSGASGTAFNTISNQLANFNFDYTTLGIPLAPHSVQFGSDAIHHGLKISACYTNAATLKSGYVTSGMSVSPTNFSITANFVMHADMWINVDGGESFTVADTNYLTDTTASMANGDSADGTASTVFYGAGYGTTGTSATMPGKTDAIWVGFLTDNGSSAMVRMYGPSVLGESSYQDGAYQATGGLSPSFPGDPYVYNIINGVNGAGTRNMLGSTGNPPYTQAAMSTNMATGVPWRNLLPITEVPLAQQTLFPQQTNYYCLPGFPTFGWHDLEVDKIGNVIIYKIDGNILATGNYSSAGTPPGSFLTFVATRTATSVASPTSGVNYTNLNFAVFANIVVSNFNSIVNVTATTPTCQEGVPGTPAVIDINRPSAGVPLTVTYTLTGSATNGSQYTTVPTTVTFASTATDTNIYIYPIDDGIPSVTRTVVLTLVSEPQYVGAGSAIVDILDGDTPTIDITGTSQAYGRYTNTTYPFGGGNNSDFMLFNATRRGLLTLGSNLVVNVAYSGTAQSGVDFAPTTSFTIPDGQATNSLLVYPLDDTAITSNTTVTVSIASGAGLGYAVGNSSATGTVVNAHYPANTVLFSDDLTSGGDSVNWGVTYGTSDEVDDPANYNVNFGASTPSTTPSGTSAALFMNCNRNNSTSPSPGAVNCYYTNQVLNGNFAVRFSMNIIEGEIWDGVSANATEGPVFGIDHSGSCSNWWYGSGFTTNLTWSSDGVWYYTAAQAGASGAGSDYSEYTGAGGTNGNAGWMRTATQLQTAFSSAFKVGNGPFTTFDGNGAQTWGQPANASPVLGYDASTWSDVEIKQQGDGLGDLVDTLSINHTQIFNYTNSTVWTNGFLMLGYEDPFGASIGNSEAGVYYANLQVVQLPATVPIVITINSITIAGGNVIIKFTTTGSSDTISSFTLTGSGTLNGTYSAVGSTTITSLGSNQFQASTPYAGGAGVLYRIQHN